MKSALALILTVNALWLATCSPRTGRVETGADPMRCYPERPKPSNWA